MRSVASIALERGAVDWPQRLRIPLPSTIVLPRFLRRPVRFMSRIEITVPRRFGLKASVALLAATGLYGVLYGDHVDDMFGSLTAAAGLEIEAVQISGQSETAELDVLNALALPPHNSIVSFDADAARQRVEELPWVASATVRKVYPDTVEVVIVEREPFALWQHDGRIALVDDTGHVVSNYVAPRYYALPFVVGAGAQSQAAEILEVIDQFPELGPQIRAATLVAGRRWNLMLNNGVSILLPEEDPLPAIIQLISLDQRDGLLSRDIVSVDLRLPGRLTVTLTDEGMEAVAELVDDRSDAAARRNGGAP